MLTRRHGRAAVIRLVVCPSLILLLVGCTGSSGQPSSAGTSAATEPAASATPAAGMCTRAEIKAAISRFFVVWNHRDAVALGWLFTADAVLEMATKHQDTLRRSEWTSVGGLGARPMIAAFCAAPMAAGGETVSSRHLGRPERRRGGRWRLCHHRGEVCRRHGTANGGIEVRL